MTNKKWQRFGMLGVMIVMGCVLIWNIFQPTAKIEGITHIIGQPVSTRASVYLNHVSESENVEVDAEQFKVDSEQSKKITVMFRGKQMTIPVQFKAPAIADVVTVSDQPQMFVVGGDYRAVFGIPDVYQPFVTYAPASDQLKPGIQDVTISLYGQTLVQSLHVYDDATMKELTAQYTLDADLQQVVQQFADKEKVDMSDIAISYQNFVTQEVAHVNAQQAHVAASTYKLPLGLYVEEKMSEFGYTLEDRLEVEPYVDIDENRAFIGQYGNRVRVGDLLLEMLENSSNVASWTLMKHFGGAKQLYDQAFEQYGLQSEASVKTIDYHANESTAGYFLQVLAHLWQNKDKYPLVVQHLKNASPNEFYEAMLPDIEIWHKYGALDEENNDVAIVFEKQPYGIAVFTENLTLTQFSKLSFLINEWHRVHEKYSVSNE